MFFLDEIEFIVVGLGLDVYDGLAFSTRESTASRRSFVYGAFGIIFDRLGLVKWVLFFGVIMYFFN